MTLRRRDGNDMADTGRMGRLDTGKAVFHHNARLRTDTELFSRQTVNIRGGLSRKSVVIKNGGVKIEPSAKGKGLKKERPVGKL